MRLTDTFLRNIHNSSGAEVERWLDVETQSRIRRPSVNLYAAICKENSLTREMVAQYAPEVLEKVFPAVKL